MLKAIALAWFAAMLVVGLSTATAAQPTQATLVVSPSPTHVGDSLVFSGCGYQPGVGVTVQVASPGAISFFGARTNADGCFSTEATETYVANVAGQYEAQSWAGSRKKAAADLSFSVT